MHHKIKINLAWLLTNEITCCFLFCIILLLKIRIFYLTRKKHQGNIGHICKVLTEFWQFDLFYSSSTIFPSIIPIYVDLRLVLKITFFYFQWRTVSSTSTVLPIRTAHSAVRAIPPRIQLIQLADITSMGQENRESRSFSWTWN